MTNDSWPKAVFTDSKNTLFAWDPIWVESCAHIRSTRCGRRRKRGFRDRRDCPLSCARAPLSLEALAGGVEG